MLLNIGNQCIFTNVNDQKVRGNLPVSHIRYSGVLMENWLPNLCVLKKKSSNELFAWSQSLNKFLHHQRTKWSFPLRSFQANMKLRFVHHYYGYPSYEIAVCSPLLWISFIWNCGLFTIIMDILHGVFLCVLGMLGDLVIIWYMIRNDLYLKMKIVLSRKLVLWNCKYGCEWIYHLFIINS